MRRCLSVMLAVICVMVSVLTIGGTTAQAATGKESSYTYLNRGLCKEYTIHDKKEMSGVVDKFPKTLQINDKNGKVREVAVTWAPTEDVQNTDRFYYVFVPTVKEDAGVEVSFTEGEEPYIMVWIEPTDSKYSNGSAELLGALPGGSNEEKCFLFLKNVIGFNTAICCGILSNIKAESAFNPNALGDKGTSYGICQWHNSKYDKRWDKLKNFCAGYGMDWQSLEGQLYYLNYELHTSFKSVWNNISACENNAEGAYLAGFVWCYYYEIPDNTRKVSEYRGNVSRDVFWPRYYGYVDNVTYTNITPGKYYLRNVGTGLYADLSGGLDLPGQNAGVFNFGGGPNQVMSIVQDGMGYAIQPSVSAGRVLKADAEMVYPGNNICLKDYVGGDKTGSWRFQKVGDAYVIRNVQNQTCVWDTDKINLFVSSYMENNLCQLWTLEPVVEKLTGTVTITGDLKYGNTITANVTNSNNTGVFSYQWRRDNVKKGEADGAPKGLTTNVISKIGEKMGKINGVSTAMEYTDKANQTGWIACTGNVITNLAAGTYYVRYKSTDYVNASEATPVKITESEEVTDIFSDVEKDQWYVAAVQKIFSKGLMNGVGDREFAPNMRLTRAQCAKVLYNLEGNPKTEGKNDFVDVYEGKWYTDAVVWCRDNKITDGIGNKKFGTELNITRQQLVTMLYRYANVKGYNTKVKKNVLGSFADRGRVENYAKNAMNWAVANKIINGKTGASGNLLDPNGLATRGECAQILYTFLEFIEKK